jgi:hypothetical protein
MTRPPHDRTRKCTVPASSVLVDCRSVSAVTPVNVDALSTLTKRSMNSTPLNYMAPGIPRSRRWPWRTLSVATAVLFLALAGPTVAIRQVESRMDAVTGSTTCKTVWPMSITSGPYTDISPLEKRLKSSGITWTPSWRFLSNTHRTIFGNATCRACCSAPPIFQLRPLLAEFAAASTDGELQEFVRVMQSGTSVQQEAAVDAACEKGLKAAQDSGLQQCR